MERILLAADAVSRVAAVVNAGGLAVLPAEGLYGIHVRPDRPAALERLERIKPREGRRGWIGLIPSADALESLAEPSAAAVALARVHWPGALTLVLRAAAGAPPSLLSEDGTIALRCPGSEWLRAVTVACGGLLVSTSANAPGAQPPALPEEIGLEDVDLLVDGGPLSGVPSTIVRVAGDSVSVLRQGAVRVGKAPP